MGKICPFFAVFLSADKKLVFLHFLMTNIVFTDQQKKGSAENPACLEVEHHFAAPRWAVTDHVNDVLTKLVDP